MILFLMLIVRFDQDNQDNDLVRPWCDQEVAMVK